MTALTWDSSMQIGIKEIDDQHAGLTRSINALYYAYMNGEEHTVLADLITQIDTYAHEHFATEQRYMAPYADEIPNYEEHIQQHGEFFTSTIRFLLKYLDTKTGITPELLDYLMDWWFTHINGTDKIMGQVLTGKGIS